MIARALPWGLLALALGIWLRWAWVSDDAYITLRTVDHLVHGHGPRYNLDERVQAFTHPLWMLLLSPLFALSRDAWLSVVLLGLSCQGAAMLALFHQARGLWAGLVAAFVLLTSRAAVDYATSGLENPLVALLLVACFRERQDLPRLALYVSLLGATRLDALLLVAPAFGLLLLEAPQRPWGKMLLCASPLWGWHLFALFYYGSWLPNSALAKLGADMPASELHLQALRYAQWSAENDPVTLLALAAGALVGLLSRDARALAWVVGLELHCAWLLHVGGDFMGGRFFVAPLWVAALLLSRARWSERAAAPALLLLALSALLPCSPLRLWDRGVRAPSREGVVDERAFYAQGTDLPSWWFGQMHPFALEGRAARSLPGSVKATIGLYGFHAGLRHHVVDKLGLADPLLARLPAELPPRWRIGHYRRALPLGYLESVEQDRNLLVEAGVHRLYEDVRLATRGALLDPARGAAIWRLQWRTHALWGVRWRWPDMEWEEPGLDLEVPEQGLGLRTHGKGGTLRLDLSEGAWVIYAMGEDRLEQHRVSGELTLDLRGIDRVVCFPLEGTGTLAAVHRPG